MSLELKQVSKVYAGETHIYPADLSLDRGSFNILLGTTLAGKTTLMRLMAGLEKPTQGEVWFDNKNVTGVSVQKRNLSMVYQQFINYPSLSVFDNIASPLRVAKTAEDEIKKRVGDISEILKISNMLDRHPSELSGGQQQRTAMARAMVKESELILLDEPLANLDFKLREELRDELPRIFADRDCVVVYATTEPTEAMLFGGYTVALYQGRVMDFGSTRNIYRSPVDVTTAQVFSEPPINIISVVKSGDRISLNDELSWPVVAQLRKQPDGEYKIGIRPHLITPVAQNDSSFVEILGQVQVTEISGSESTIHFEAYGSSWVSLSRGVYPYKVGARTTLYANIKDSLYFDCNEQLIQAQMQQGA